MRPGHKSGQLYASSSNALRQGGPSAQMGMNAQAEQSSPALDTPINAHGTLASPIQSSPYALQCRAVVSWVAERRVVLEGKRPPGLVQEWREGALAACWAADSHCTLPSPHIQALWSTSYTTKRYHQKNRNNQRFNDKESKHHLSKMNV